MSKRGDREFLSDIEEAIGRIMSYTDEMSYKEFISDAKTQDAVVRNIEILGEATKNLTTALKDEHKDIEWVEIAGMRDKIIHFYFGIKWDIVWDVIKNKLPELEKKIKRLIDNLED